MVRLERMERVVAPEVVEPYVRPMTAPELEEMRANGWRCGRCDKIAVHRVVGGGNFRLCDEHAEATRRGLETL